jgi:hypothetical protein
MAEYTYKGYDYDPVLDADDDNVKVFHDVFCPDGTIVHMPISPYTIATEDQFKEFVDAREE